MSRSPNHHHLSKRDTADAVRSIRDQAVAGSSYTELLDALRKLAVRLDYEATEEERTGVVGGGIAALPSRPIPSLVDGCLPAYILAPPGSAVTVTLPEPRAPRAEADDQADDDESEEDA